MRELALQPVRRRRGVGVGGGDQPVAAGRRRAAGRPRRPSRAAAPARSPAPGPQDRQVQAQPRARSPRATRLGLVGAGVGDDDRLEPAAARRSARASAARQAPIVRSSSRAGTTTTLTRVHRRPLRDQLAPALVVVVGLVGEHARPRPSRPYQAVKARRRRARSRVASKPSPQAAYFSVRVPIVDQKPGTVVPAGSRAGRGRARRPPPGRARRPSARRAARRPAARFSARHTSPAASTPSRAVRIAASTGIAPSSSSRPAAAASSERGADPARPSRPAAPVDPLVAGDDRERRRRALDRAPPRPEPQLNAVIGQPVAR